MDENLRRLRCGNLLTDLATELQNVVARARQSPLDDVGWRARIGRVMNDIDEALPTLPVMKPRQAARFGYAEHLLINESQHVGYGDIIQAMALLPLIRPRCGTLYLAVPHEMRELVEHSTKHLAPRCVIGPFDRPTEVTRELSWLLLRVHPRYAEKVSGEPYLAPPPGSVLFPEGPPTRHVGIAWASHHRWPEYCGRSTSARVVVEPLAAIPNVVLHSIQPDRPDEVEGMPVRVHRVADFSESSRLVAAMDCVVTIDAALAHLAPALGVPTFVLLGPASDARWERAGGISRWYKTAECVALGARQGAVDEGDRNNIAPSAQRAAQRICAGTWPPRRPVVWPARAAVGNRLGTEWTFFREDVDALFEWTAFDPITEQEGVTVLNALQRVAGAVR